MQQVPLQAAGIEERLQHLASRVDQLTSLGLLPPSPAPQHIPQHKVKMDNDPTLQPVQHIQYPLWHRVCISKITITDHMHQMEHPPWHQVHLSNHT